MIILGIDPGYERIGLAIIERAEKGREILIFSDCFQTDKKLPHAERLKLIAEYVRIVVEKYKPNLLGIEKLYFNENQKTAMRVAEARGTIIVVAKEAGLQIEEFTPLQIKIAITGYGRADKKQVSAMVNRLVKINKKVVFDDEYDAIATAITTSVSFPA